MNKCIECEGLVLARGLCRKHYQRWYKHGDASIVKRAIIASGVDSPNYKHGKWDHKLYKTWRNMLSRCNNKNDHAYMKYGGRGITVCQQWLDINRFIQDMGERPEGASIDRIDSNGNYEPSNCRWADSTTQARNRTFVKLTKEIADKMRAEKMVSGNGRGEGSTRSQIADKYGISVATVKKVLSGDYWK